MWFFVKQKTKNKTKPKTVHKRLFEFASQPRDQHHCIGRFGERMERSGSLHTDIQVKMRARGTLKPGWCHVVYYDPPPLSPGGCAVAKDTGAGVLTHLPLPPGQPLISLPLADVVWVPGLEGQTWHGPGAQARLTAQSSTHAASGSLQAKNEMRGCIQMLQYYTKHCGILHLGATHLAPEIVSNWTILPSCLVMASPDEWRDYVAPEAIKLQLPIFLLCLPLASDLTWLRGLTMKQ